jgi:hypothetical protein
MIARRADQVIERVVAILFATHCNRPRSVED